MGLSAEYKNQSSEIGKSLKSIFGSPFLKLDGIENAHFVFDLMSYNTLNNIPNF